MLDALKDINLRDLDVILEALDDYKEKAQNEDRALTQFTINKIEKAHEEQIAWLKKEYEKAGN